MNPSDSGTQAPVQANGTVRLAAQSLPLSVYASEQARQLFARDLPQGAAPPGASLLALRAFYDRFNERLLERVSAHYAVEITPARLGEVEIMRVRPAGHSAGGPLLINLHGGGFAWGAGNGALVEAIPMACRMGVEVLALDYRMAPEHQFPAASEDVAAVYGVLLRDRAPGSIGIYGNSSGAILTTQSLAWFHARGLPMPGAIALLCGSGAEMQGDSAWLAQPLCGELLGGTAADGSPAPLRLDTLPYMAGVDPNDPLAFPVMNEELLRLFPPTALLSGNRDFAASSLSWFHRRLLHAGVDARLVQFDGMWHSFHIFPELPESAEAHELLARFFRRVLGSA